MYRVLLVEDEEIELETLRDYIDWKKNGISRVFTARNGRRALERNSAICIFIRKSSRKIPNSCCCR